MTNVRKTLASFKRLARCTFAQSRTDLDENGIGRGKNDAAQRAARKLGSGAAPVSKFDEQKNATGTELPTKPRLPTIR